MRDGTRREKKITRDSTNFKLKCELTRATLPPFHFAKLHAKEHTRRVRPRVATSTCAKQNMRRNGVDFFSNGWRERRMWYSLFCIYLGKRSRGLRHYLSSVPGNLVSVRDCIFWLEFLILLVIF